MNKLLTYKGGQPVYLEDLDFIQKSIGGAFEEFVKALTDSGDTGDPILLSGLDRFGTYGFNEGVIAFGGRIFYVDGHNDIDDGKHFINFITKKGEPRRLKNGSIVDVYEYEEAVWDSTGWDLEDISWIDNELTRRLWKSIWLNIERDSNIQVPPVDASEDRQSIGGKLTRTAGGYYVFQGELFTGDQYVGEQPYWASDTVAIYKRLPSVTVYVPMCYNNSIIPGKVTTSGDTITVAFWTENAVPGQIYNFTVMI